MFSRLGNLFIILALLSGCKTIPVKREIKAVNEISTLNPSQKFIKAHMKNGWVYILHTWTFNPAKNSLSGFGSLLDINRTVKEVRGDLNPKAKSQGEMFQIALSDIALVETNDPGPSIAGGLAVVTGVTGVIAVLCLTNPKACFGSCPTFYANDGNAFVLQAEGFSTSISPSLEKNDIDMLYHAKASTDFEVMVTNEALETHVIRQANILAIPREENERVFASTDGMFYSCKDIRPPIDCSSTLGDCSDKVSHVDGNEYFSSADEINLNSKEEIVVRFPANGDEHIGLIIGKRQTLLTTYLLYQGLAYMGRSVTYWMAEFERGVMKQKKGVIESLGSVEVFSQDENGKWTFEGSVNETGPIVSDFSVLPLRTPHKKEVVLKLRLNKGLWRIDYLALGYLGQATVPAVVRPDAVETIHGSDSDPLTNLLDDDKFLITYPGDVYKITYRLPFEKAELFMDSKGYYLEWIREEWIKEQDFVKLNQMINRPEKFLRRAAKDFKKLEPDMEHTFWNSRYVK